MKLKLLTILPLAAALLGAASCETYEKVAENDSFGISAEVSATTAGAPVVVTVSVADGVKEGESRLSVVLKDTKTNSSPSFTVLLDGKSSIRGVDTWSFDADGKAVFHLTDVPAGEYAMTLSVIRWYHTATSTTSFTVNP